MKKPTARSRGGSASAKFAGPTFHVLGALPKRDRGRARLRDLAATLAPATDPSRITGRPDGRTLTAAREPACRDVAVEGQAMA